MNKEKNIVLIGMMGCGKTTVGKSLQEKIFQNYVFVDIDEQIETKAQKSVSEIFAQDGELFFRQLESQLIEKFALEKNQIISTGGGAFVDEKNITNLKKNGIVFYLKTEVETILKRLENDESRPLLKTEDKKNKLSSLLKKREASYIKADFVIKTDGKSVEAISKEILNCLK